MRSRGVRLTLVGLFVIAAGAAGYLFWMGESRARSDRDAARAFGFQASTAARAILELRAAQQAYVAAGQGDAFWAGKATSALSTVRDTLAGLRTVAASAQAQTEIDAALVTLQDFEQLDRRARDYARSGQKLLASDLIFSNGFDTTAEALNAVDRARDAELRGRDEAAAGLRRRQIYALGAAAAAALLTVLLLAPRTRHDEVDAALQEPAHAPAHHLGLDLGAALDEGWTPPKKAGQATAGAELARPSAALPPAIDLPGMAALCTDLARVVDMRALPGILERAAGVLDASGIVLWISDPDARELSPIVTHGYTPQIVSRLGTILRDAENATAAAFRTSLVQTVKADAVSHGAIAAPLVTPNGCVGVMAAEVRHDGEKDGAKLAAAAIVAAQLATLVGPPSSRAQAKVEAV